MGEARKVASVAIGQDKRQKEVILGTPKMKRRVQFAALMNICHLKNAELEPKYQKYKGRVVLRGDIVKNDSGSYAVFTEQGSSASKMTAAKVMDVIAILPDCAGQAVDAVSACTKVRIEDAQIVPNSRVRLPRYMDTSSTTQVAQIVVNH